jgi:predicted RNA-binding protein
MGSYTPPPSNRTTLLLISAPQTRPYQNSKEFLRFIRKYRAWPASQKLAFDTIFVSPFLGLVPLELNTIYPLAQNELPQEVISDEQAQIILQLEQYVKRNRQYTRFVGIFASTEYWQKFSQLCEQLFIEIKKPISLFFTDFSNKSLQKVISNFT